MACGFVIGNHQVGSFIKIVAITTPVAQIQIGAGWQYPILLIWGSVPVPNLTTDSYLIALRQPFCVYRTADCITRKIQICGNRTNLNLRGKGPAIHFAKDGISWQDIWMIGNPGRAFHVGGKA